MGAQDNSTELTSGRQDSMSVPARARAGNFDISVGEPPTFSVLHGVARLLVRLTGTPLPHGI